MATTVINKYYTEVNKLELFNGGLLTFSNNEVIYISNLFDFLNGTIFPELFNESPSNIASNNDIFAFLFKYTPMHQVGGVYEINDFINKIKSLWTDYIVLKDGQEREIQNYEIVALMYGLRQYLKSSTNKDLFEIIIDSSSATKIKLLSDPTGAIWDQ